MEDYKVITREDAIKDGWKVSRVYAIYDRKNDKIVLEFNDRQDLVNFINATAKL